MTAIVVCPLSALEATFRSSGAEDVVTLMTARHMDVPRLDAKRYLRLEFSDIAQPRDGYVLPGAEHVVRLLRFAEAWTRDKPLLIHCYAGVSRSTAAAFILACALRPQDDERCVAARLRALSPTATPNPRLVALADALCERSGRMIRAIEAIGRGAECFEGTPFSLALTDQIPPYQS